MSRALAKTITFRTVATIMDFSVTYIVVQDLAIAAGLSAFGFVVGPFVYFGHERLWDRFFPEEGTRWRCRRRRSSCRRRREFTLVIPGHRAAVNPESRRPRPFSPQPGFRVPTCGRPRNDAF